MAFNARNNRPKCVVLTVFVLLAARADVNGSPTCAPSVARIIASESVSFALDGCQEVAEEH
jgi:hypothetical protein